MIKIGICGAGFMGGMHASCYGALPNARVTAVADVRAQQAHAVAGEHGAEVYRDAKALIEKADVDAVDVCLPTHLHADAVIRAAKRGVHIFCEKPLGRTLREANRIVKAVEKAGVSCQVGQVIRFWPEYVALKKYVDGRKLGRLTALSLVRVSPRPGWSWKGWLMKGDLSGGVILDMHIHDTDFVRYLLGEPAAVHSVGTMAKGCWDYVFTHYRYRNIAVSAEGGWNMPAGFPFDMQFRAVFEKGALYYSSLNNPLTLYGADGKSTQVKLSQPKVKGGGDGGNISALGGYFNELQYFVNCLNRGRKPEAATVENARDSVALILKEMASAARNARRV